MNRWKCVIIDEDGFTKSLLREGCYYFGISAKRWNAMSGWEQERFIERIKEKLD